MAKMLEQVEFRRYVTQTVDIHTTTLKELIPEMPEDIRLDVEQLFDSLEGLLDETKGFFIQINDFDGSITNKWQRFDLEYACIFDAESLINWLMKYVGAKKYDYDETKKLGVVNSG